VAIFQTASPSQLGRLLRVFVKETQSARGCRRWARVSGFR
jgi:hypothetical protein